MLRDAESLLSVFLHNRNLFTDTHFAVPNKQLCRKESFSAQFPRRRHSRPESSESAAYR